MPEATWKACFEGDTLQFAEPVEVLASPGAESCAVGSGAVTFNAVGAYRVRETGGVVNVVCFDDRWLRAVRLDPAGSPYTEKSFKARARKVLAGCSSSNAPGALTGVWEGGVDFGVHGGAYMAGITFADVEGT